mmetsp:Transcript_38268/g.89000  ORF Transcript_38268/g.89000 Transcript_38268/m.89000 type:complete len:253 (-) Transcript_38268:150-908(-)
MCIVQSDHKAVTVPMNIEYVMHRYGEFTMLMLGESILSLIIVDHPNDSEEEKKNYHMIFIMGITAVFLLQVIDFDSQPHNPNHHALRYRIRGSIFEALKKIYYAALVLTGALYKIMMMEYGGTDYDKYYKGDEETRHRDIAWLFCASITTACVTLDLTNLSHSATFDDALGLRDSATGQIKGLMVLLLLAQIGLYFFMMTVTTYDTKPTDLSIFGAVLVLLTITIQKIRKFYYPIEHDDSHAHGHDVQHDIA